MAVATAASQHHALGSVLRIPPSPFHSRLTHARASLYLLLPTVSFSVPLVPIRRFPSTASQPPSLQSLVLLSSLSLFRLAAHRITPSLRDYLPSAFAFFLFLFLFLPFTVALPLLMEKERKTKRMVEDPHAPLNHHSSLLCTKCSPENPRDGESGRKVQVDKKERDRCIL